MSRKLKRLPVRLPENAKYVLEIARRSKGMMLISRYVELPDGRRLAFPLRRTAAYGSRSFASAKVRELNRAHQHDRYL